MSCLNVLSIIQGCSKEDIYKALLSEAHELGLMPDDVHCVKALLKTQGFFQQPGVKETVSIEDFCSAMDSRCHDDQIAIVQVGLELFAVVPGEYAKLIGLRSGYEQYQCVGSVYPTINRIQEVWVKWKDCKDHSPVRRRKDRGSGAREEPLDNEFFHYYLANPVGKHTGDCPVRALASVCGISWHEAMDRLAKSAGYATTKISIDLFINKMLESEGFYQHSPITVNGKLLTGKEFCREISTQYHKGEKIFAYVGSSHVAAVLPFQEAGVTRYKIVDSWDSTGRKIGSYFVKPVSYDSIRNVPELKVGTKVQHPIFGAGMIQEISLNGWLVVSFLSAGQRLLDIKWVLQNCRRCE